MHLFRSTSFTPADLKSGCQWSTPLGTVGLQYAFNSRRNSLELKQRYQHSSKPCEIYQWVAPECVLEELFVDDCDSQLVHSPGFTCRAVVVRLQTSTAIQRFSADLSWKAGYQWLEGISEPGEGLEARSWFNDSWQVTVGTEDSEYLASRARVERWMPRRLAAYFEALSENVLHVQNDSVSIHRPEMQSGERCQFQFVIANGRRCNDGIEGWLAVDRRPEELLLAGNCD
jgi:hypothetical protein